MFSWLQLQALPQCLQLNHFREYSLVLWCPYPDSFKNLRKIDGPITLIPAAIPKWAHVEDEIIANCVKSALEKNLSTREEILAHAQKYIEQIHASGRPVQLTKKLAGTGCDDDVPICLHTDRFSFLAEIDFSKTVQDIIAPILMRE